MSRIEVVPFHAEDALIPLCGDLHICDICYEIIRELTLMGMMHRQNPVPASPPNHCFTLFHISGFLFVSVHVDGIDPPKHVLLSGLGFHVIDRMELLMWNRNVEIDRTHIRAICNKIGERLRISLSGEAPELSLQMRRQLDQLREPDSPSIVPAIGRF
jgi:hypothetical protein